MKRYRRECWFGPIPSNLDEQQKERDRMKKRRGRRRRWRRWSRMRLGSQCIFPLLFFILFTFISSLSLFLKISCCSPTALFHSFCCLRLRIEDNTITNPFSSPAFVLFFSAIVVLAERNLWRINSVLLPVNHLVISLILSLFQTSSSHFLFSCFLLFCLPRY